MAHVPRWRPLGVDGGICPKRDAADLEPEPARRPDAGAGDEYSEGGRRRLHGPTGRSGRAGKTNRPRAVLVHSASARETARPGTIT